MVIANSNSTSTLISLDDVQKFAQDDLSIRKRSDYIRTDVLLPEDDCWSDGNDSGSCLSEPPNKGYLYLPASFESVDICLHTIPEVVAPVDELLSSPPRRFTVGSREKLIYVGQGELAHSTSRQSDIIASDKATTCHILAFRSSSAKGPVVSLAHIDSVGYESCIRSMINEQLRYHNDAKEIHSKHAASMINIDVYIMGGFDDNEASSRAISDYLLHLLSQIAKEQSHQLTLTLKLCAISSMNDDGHSCPIGRGLGISIQTGEAFLISVDIAVVGPAPQLRSARVWSSGNLEKKLSVIHTCYSNEIVIQPFRYVALYQMDRLLSLDDSQLVTVTSTSPDVEEDDFCAIVRATLTFIKHVNCERVFGPGCRKPLVFCRLKKTNQWKLKSSQF